MATATASSSSATTSTIATSRPTATITTTTATPPRPQLPPPPAYPIPHTHPPQYHHHHHHHIYAAQNLHIRPQTQTPNSSTQQQGGIVYPVASSGRGFIPRPARPQDQTVTVANNNPNLASATYTIPSASSRAHPHSAHSMRQHPTHLQHQQHYVGVASASIQGLPVAGQVKVSPTPSPVSDSNGLKNSRDRSRDDTLIVVRDRKARISDGTSLYVLCRSWLRNGFPKDGQPHNGEVIRPLPRPDPTVDIHSPKKDDEMEEDEKVEKSVAQLSMEDLLKRHINHAKKVRARLREGRLKRIARYKNRLGLLLPSQVEQFRNDMTAGN